MNSSLIDNDRHYRELERQDIHGASWGHKQHRRFFYVWATIFVALVGIGTALWLE